MLEFSKVYFDLHCRNWLQALPKLVTGIPDTSGGDRLKLVLQQCILQICFKVKLPLFHFYTRFTAVNRDCMRSTTFSRASALPAAPPAEPHAGQCQCQCLQAVGMASTAANSRALFGGTWQ